MYIIHGSLNLILSWQHKSNHVGKLQLKMQKNPPQKIFFPSEMLFCYVVFLFKGKTYWDVIIYHRHVLHTGVEKHLEECHLDDLQAQGEQEWALK